MVKEKINKDMYIREVVDKHPETIKVFSRYNIGCIGCIAAAFEKIKDIAAIHGVDIDSFVKELNESIEK